MARQDIIINCISIKKPLKISKKIGIIKSMKLEKEFYPYEISNEIKKIELKGIKQNKYKDEKGKEDAT